MTKSGASKSIHLAQYSDYPSLEMIELNSYIPTGNSYEDSFNIVEQVLGKNIAQGSLFAYLFRRFGFPNKGSDPFKELAKYHLTTKRSDMLLQITPYSGGDTHISFTFLVPHKIRQKCDAWISRDRNAHAENFLDWIEEQNLFPEWADELSRKIIRQHGQEPGTEKGWRTIMPWIAIVSRSNNKENFTAQEQEAGRWYQSVRTDYETLHPVPDIQWRNQDIDSWDDEDPLKPYALAMIGTLKDLLRPVWIRDCPIGIYGEIDERNPAALGNKGKDADYFKGAGYPSGDLGNLDPEGFARLHRAILEINDDPSVAIAQALDIISNS